MKAVFSKVAPYADNAMNLPVRDLDAALPYYEQTLGFRLVSRSDSPPRSAIFARDAIQIGLAENGGDPAQEGCFFEVDSVETAYAEIHGEPAKEGSFRLDQFDGVPYRVFFLIAPDGLCYMLGERTTA